MCFSAEANFVASGVIGAVGVATLMHAPKPRAVLFAAVPLLFALHQFIEAFVWLGLDGHLSTLATGHFVFLFMLYAQAALPLLMPLAVLLIEPQGPRRWLIASLTMMGGLLAAFVFAALVLYPSTAKIEHHSIVYDNPGTEQTWIAIIYVVTTCGALITSSHRVVRWFGLLNLAGVAATLIVRGYAFTSVWCLYAAVISVMLYWQFRAGHIDLARPNSRFREAEAS